MRATMVSNVFRTVRRDKTKQGCVMASFIFTLFFSVTLKHQSATLADIDTGEIIHFRSTGRKFNHQHFMKKKLDGDNRNVGRPWLRYEDKFKANLAAIQIDNKYF